MPDNEIISSWLREEKEAIIIDVLVSPKASRNKIVSIYDGRLKIRVAAIPENGKANTELIKFLAKILDIPTYDIEITAGYSSKKKTLRIKGVTKQTVEKLVEIK